MYSTIIKPKVDLIFDNLRKKVSSTIWESSTSNETLSRVTRLVSSELSTRSKSILSDMLFELSDKMLESDFFSDISKQNKFFEINLRQEILSKYQFAPSTTVNYKEASRTVQALKVGGATLVIGGVAEIGVVLIAGLSLSSLVPIPISVLVVASIGAALADYYAIEPKKNKKALAQALDSYLVEAKQQFLNWFDEVEKYFNMRVEEIKQTL
ncbi:MAG: hypothetical protein ACLRQ0_09190 [Monoglobales bacterium]